MITEESGEKKKQILHLHHSTTEDQKSTTRVQTTIRLFLSAVHHMTQEVEEQAT